MEMDVVQLVQLNQAGIVAMETLPLLLFAGLYTDL